MVTKSPSTLAQVSEPIMTPERISELLAASNNGYGNQFAHFPYDFARAIEQHILASQSAAPVAASGAAEMTAQGVFEVLHSEFQGASNRQLLAATAHILVASGSAQPASALTDLLHRLDVSPNARTEHFEIAKEIRAALLAAAQAATVTGASTLGQQVARAQAEMATWSPELRASVRLEGGDAIEDAQTIATGYECGTLATNPTDLGATIHLHYESKAEAENAFKALSVLIDAAIKAMAPGVKP